MQTRLDASILHKSCFADFCKLKKNRAKLLWALGALVCHLYWWIQSKMNLFSAPRLLTCQSPNNLSVPCGNKSWLFWRRQQIKKKTDRYPTSANLLTPSYFSFYTTFKDKKIFFLKFYYFSRFHQNFAGHQIRYDKRILKKSLYFSSYCTLTCRLNIQYTEIPSN